MNHVIVIAQIGISLMVVELVKMKKLILFFIFFIPIAYAFTGSSASYQTTANIGLGGVLEQSSNNYITEGEMVYQPIGLFQSINYRTYLGPYYLAYYLVGADRDGDGIPDDVDDCPDDYGTLDYNGCTAAISVQADRHTVGAGSKPGSTKESLANLEIKAYDKSKGSCAADIGISWQNYAEIVENCTPIITRATDETGNVLIGMMPGDYLIIGQNGTDKHLGVSAGITTGMTMEKYLQQIIKADGEKVSAKYTKKEGSLLLIIEPEYIIWDGTEELYPFVFDSIGDWEITATVAPPEGFVADYDALTEEITSEVEAVQFTITDIGSDWVPTEMEYEIKHKGKKEKIKTKIGVAMSKELAKKKGLDTKEKREKKGFKGLKVFE